MTIVRLAKNIFQPGLGYGLDESAILTLQEKWKFQPGMLEGKPVPVEATIEMSFRLY